ncbi:3-hydroxyacyl-CoA dehydrogenase [Flexivirga endophytica]|uniref:3-hydroxyacyl-CoA dehydrogenase n=1 Tax=Flexivirga endophytica TaxID=1849103 RepID=A0A916T3S8_9MICO|nr:3-hydroxyacyl-CoA dehydrogenase family protein [Flexivirga endophytica]GGB30154.1 3-hydroxyacyl-CoA dehydrogenase [Flexivirga endophytica]GHB51086.1 3-hydroxyacyl-CoA dehydrogenase [Flexivirga endophytica]
MTDNVLPERIGVIGAGRMGAGIAHAFLLGGADVVAVESSDEAAIAGRERIERSLARSVARGQTDHGELTMATDRQAVARCELIVEAVPEDADLKAAVLSEIAGIAPAARLGTNTSSLSVTDLAKRLPSPDQLIGLHFFNPVPSSSLVEIVVAETTPDALVTAAQGWVAAIGKTAVTVQDSPGFASSRLGVAIALEAMRMVDEGVASAQDIDTAMELGYRHPVGPLKTTDLVGLDVRLAIAEHLERELGARFAPPQVLRDKVAAGHLGRKAGQGFYDWTAEK